MNYDAIKNLTSQFSSTHCENFIVHISHVALGEVGYAPAHIHVDVGVAHACSSSLRARLQSWLKLHRVCTRVHATASRFLGGQMSDDSGPIGRVLAVN